VHQILKQQQYLVAFWAGACFGCRYLVPNGFNVMRNIDAMFERNALLAQGVTLCVPNPLSGPAHHQKRAGQP
jgi:hypothetical protein